MREFEIVSAVCQWKQAPVREDWVDGTLGVATTGRMVRKLSENLMKGPGTYLLQELREPAA